MNFKVVVFVAFVLVMQPVYSDGGISAMHGLGEGFAFLGMATLIIITWLVFSLIILFKKTVIQKTLSFFRKAILALILLLFIIMGILALIVFSFYWQVMPFVLIYSIIMIGLTELVIWGARKKT